MNTGLINNWNGSMTDIGPIYPFVGWEVPMVILCLIFWVGWHYLQMRAENRTLEDKARHLRQGDNLVKAVEAENTPERM
jgi:hypothetical protein